MIKQNLDRLKKFTEHYYKDFSSLNVQTHPASAFFWYEGEYGRVVLICLMHHHIINKKVSIDKIIKDCEKFCSRRTINYFLNKAVKMGFIEKEYSIFDKRITLISPSKITINEYERWTSELINKLT